MPHQARLLAFDTATERMLLALTDGERTWLSEQPGGAVASSTLLPGLQALLAEAGLDWAQLDAIGFGRGPGAFTGLRSSAAVAQGLAFGSGRPVLALDSLELVAEAWRLQCAAPLAEGEEVGVAMDARMNEIYAARYAWRNEGWQAVGAAALCNLPALQAAWAAPVTPMRALVGSALLWPAAPWGLPAAECCAEPTARAAALASLARRAFAAGRSEDAAQAVPMYLRDKVAQTTAERAAAKAASGANVAKAEP